MSSIEEIDYIDADVAYLLGLIMARGRISESGGVKQVIIEFPYRSLEVDGFAGTVHTSDAIKLGLQQIQERVLELTGSDVSIVSGEKSVSLVLRFLRNTMVWRNIRGVMCWNTIGKPVKYHGKLLSLSGIGPQRA